MKKIKILALILFMASSLAAQTKQACPCTFDLTDRVTDEYGRSVSGAVVSFIGCWDEPCETEDWQTRSVVTNTFGYFTIEDVLLGEYVVLIRHRRYPVKVVWFPVYDPPQGAFVLARK